MANDIYSAISNANKELAENRRKAQENANRSLNELESYDNKMFLRMVSVTYGFLRDWKKKLRGKS